MCFIDDPLPDSGNIHTKNLQNQSDSEGVFDYLCEGGEMEEKFTKRDQHSCIIIRIKN